MFTIDGNIISCDVKTAFGEAKITCLKSNDDIHISFIHPFIKKDLKVDKKETKKGLEELIEWISK